MALRVRTDHQVMAADSSWSGVAREKAESSAAQCAGQDGAPHVAFCVAGAARSFATPLVLTMLEHNLHTAFGGAPSSRFFLQLKQVDSDKLRQASTTTSFAHHRESTIANLLAALGTPWLHAVTAEAVVVNGSGASDSVGAADGTDRVARSDGERWRSFVPAFPCNATAGRALSVRHHAVDESRACCDLSSYLRSQNNQERMLLHQLGLTWCHGAITRYEGRSRRAFDLVVHARPDLVWWEPVVFDEVW